MINLCSLYIDLSGCFSNFFSSLRWNMFESRHIECLFSYTRAMRKEAWRKGNRKNGEWERFKITVDSAFKFDKEMRILRTCIAHWLSLSSTARTPCMNNSSFRNEPPMMRWFLTEDDCSCIWSNNDTCCCKIIVTWKRETLYYENSILDKEP